MWTTGQVLSLQPQNTAQAMILKILLLVSLLTCSECVYVYSSFYAPLVNPHILGYRVDARFDENSGLQARDVYQKLYGYRGENLIADLGNGKRPSDVSTDNQVGYISRIFCHS